MYLSLCACPFVPPSRLICPVSPACGGGGDGLRRAPGRGGRRRQRREKKREDYPSPLPLCWESLYELVVFLLQVRHRPSMIYAPCHRHPLGVCIYVRSILCSTTCPVRSYHPLSYNRPVAGLTGAYLLVGFKKPARSKGCVRVPRSRAGFVVIAG